ncbi:MAG: ABC transporter ATP-binding protein [Thiotrichaceae bacterium]|nr:ABC transporter ATP-binding protein [Thiotrichaceae bacterium]
MININNVSKIFRQTKVLDGINLDINKGDRIALVGSNGSGKTTLIRCLLGEYIHEGEILVNKLQPRQHREEVLKQISFVPQLPPPLRMPVGQLIHFSAEVCHSDPEKIYTVSESLGLDARKFKSQAFVKLSGGQKQKLLISIALGRDSKLLIMDEPAANLDPEARHSFFNLLAQKQHDTAMLISSHRLDEVAALVNRVIELDQGKVILNDQVADQVDMESILDCEIQLTHAEPAFAKMIEEWGFISSSDGMMWQGNVAGPDRLRFLGAVSRYSGILNGINMKEKS